MATRLLSFLSDIEKALADDPAAKTETSWDSQRMVNYKAGLARMTLTAKGDAGDKAPAGSIFLQRFLLADGSLCLKATLSWDSSPNTSLISVYAKPKLDWGAAAKQVASAWLIGPPATSIVENLPAPMLNPLRAVAS